MTEMTPLWTRSRGTLWLHIGCIGDTVYDMGMGQNLLIMWYKGWPSTLRFTGGTGFWPTSIYDLAACSPGVPVDGHSRLLIQMNIELPGHDKCSIFWINNDVILYLYIIIYNNIYIYYGYICITVLLSIQFSSCATFEYHALALVVAQHGPKT